MPDLTPFLNAASTGAAAADITGYPSDAVTAAAYAAWIQSVTGSVPQVVKSPQGKYALLVLSKEQVIAMQKWLDSQVRGALAVKTPARVQMELGPVVTPWALKYAVPFIAAAVLSGWLLHWYIVR